ncbi:MAG TPA: hypothetical protein VNP37_20500 [Actinomycetospora sp.]|nr:hypothetical protein [Actinomycetospora sp.]
MADGPAHAARPARRRIVEPGEPAGDLATRLHLDDPALQRRYRADLDRVRDAELRAEVDTEGVRLH